MSCPREKRTVLPQSWQTKEHGANQAGHQQEPTPLDAKDGSGAGGLVEAPRRQAAVQSDAAAFLAFDGAGKTAATEADYRGHNLQLEREVHCGTV